MNEIWPDFTMDAAESGRATSTVPWAFPLDRRAASVIIHAMPTATEQERRVPQATAGAVLACAASLALTGVAAAARPDPAAACDSPGWRVASASVDGAPAGFDAGDAGRTYAWHDEGWHLRTTDVNNAAHLYTGTISASPGATFVDAHKIRLDPPTTCG